MSYATQADIESRHPGELKQAGPQVGGVLDEAAVALACVEASGLIDGYLKAAPFSLIVPWPGVTPDWLVDLAVDIALYQTTPTAIASQDDFKDRRRRYEDALALLEAIAAGKFAPPGVTLGTVPRADQLYIQSQPRLFGRGRL
ncbi:MAG: phage protein Gp36 family protein [Candidatus Contendobacter sp.]